jgi:hypothetical protein
MATGGLYVTFETTGVLRPLPSEIGSSPGDGSILVTDLGGVNDPAVVINALYRGAAVPLPIAGRYTVSLQAVNAAITGGTRIALSRYTG